MPSRRSFLQNALLFAVAGPAALQVHAVEQGQYEYDGPDSVDAFKEAIAERSANGVLVSVLHATWCGPCKQLFKDIAGMNASGSYIGVMAVDIEKYPNITKAMSFGPGTPQAYVHARGILQSQFQGLMTPVHMTHLRTLSNIMNSNRQRSLRP